MNSTEFILLLAKLLLVLLLVLLNGFFVAAEFALVKVRGSRLTQLVNEGNVRADKTLQVTRNLDAYLSATQLGITLASLGLGWVGEPVIAKLIIEPLMHAVHAPHYLVHPVAIVVSFILITFLHIVLGELAPKSLAISKPEATALWLSAPLMMFYRIAFPAIWLLNSMANFVLGRFGIEPAHEHEASHTEEEIRILMKQSQKSGHIDKDELTLVENIFDFSERVAREVMIPRIMIETLYTDLSFEENFDIAIKTRLTRYPLAEKDKDHLIGFLHVADLYHAALFNKDQENIDIRSLARPIAHVPESMEVSQVLRVMQKDRAQMVVVIDEYGGTAGILTLEDLMEEIVGDINDEFNVELPEIQILPDRISVDGRVLIEKINELFEIDIEDEDVDTLGGWMMSELNDIPHVGVKIEFDGIEFEITEIDHLRILRIDIHSLPPSLQEGNEEPEASGDTQI